MKDIEIAVESQADRSDIATESQLSQCDKTIGRYTAVQIAEDLGVGESTIRNWFVKVSQVCPQSWLKVGGKHTDLSTALLSDYSKRVSAGSMAVEAWILEVQQQFAEELPKVTEAIPEDKEIVLRSNTATAIAMDEHLAQLDEDILAATQNVDQMMDALEADELALLEAEMQAARSKGAKKATLLYAAEKQGQNEAAQILRQREITRRQQG